LAERVVGVGERLDDQERCAFTFGAFVFHEFFDEAEVIDLFFVKFPDSPPMKAGIATKAAVASAIRLIVAVEWLDRGETAFWASSSIHSGGLN